MADYRLLANEVLREALDSGKTSRGALARFARDRGHVHQLNGEHAVVAANIALSLAKAHRRRLRKGPESRPPYIRRLFLRADRETFHLDRETGKLRLSLRAGQWCSFFLHLSAYHQQRLNADGVRVKQLQVSQERAVLFLERTVPEPYLPSALLALDTNESSLDGVAVTRESNRLVHVPYPEIRRVQSTHFERRRKLGQKKAHDRRLARKLQAKEGQRERNRVRSRLHKLTTLLLDILVVHHAALALEDLSRMLRFRRRAKGRSRHRTSRSVRRRLSSWPRRELHRQLEYKAFDRGVPVYWVNPYRTSVTCPKCGDITRPRSRVGPTFTCEHCGWTMDRQLNAGLNVGRTALREIAELGGLRLDLDALSDDAMRPRYPFEESDGHGRSGRKGRDALESPPQGGKLQ